MTPRMALESLEKYHVKPVSYGWWRKSAGIERCDICKNVWMEGAPSYHKPSCPFAALAKTEQEVEG